MAGKGKGKDQANHPAPAPASGSTRSKEEATKKSSRQNSADRFIPNRPDFDRAHYLMTEDKEKPAESSPPGDAYTKRLEKALNLDRTSPILTFGNKPPTRPAGTIPNDSSTTQQSKSTKQSKSTTSTRRTPEADIDDPDFGGIR